MARRRSSRLDRMTGFTSVFAKASADRGFSFGGKGGEVSGGNYECHESHEWNSPFRQDYRIFRNGQDFRQGREGGEESAEATTNHSNITNGTAGFDRIHRISVGGKGGGPPRRIRRSGPWASGSRASCVAGGRLVLTTHPKGAPALPDSLFVQFAQFVGNPASVFGCSIL